MGVFPSGQWGQTVNLLLFSFGGSNPPAYVSLTFVQKKTASVSLHQRFFHGRGWITQAALLKTAHGAVFALSSATAPQLFESIRPALRRFHVKQKSSVITTLDFLVGAGGFEPPKLKAADLQSVPIGHSGTRPYTVFCSRGLPVYITTRERVCQLLFTAFSEKKLTARLSRGDGHSGGLFWRNGGCGGS